MRARKLAALVLAVVLAVLAGGDVAAYAGTSKTCAPRTAIREALTRREGRDMAEKKTTRPKDGGKEAAHLDTIQATLAEVAALAEAQARESGYPVYDVDDPGVGPRPVVTFPREVAWPPILVGYLFGADGSFAGRLGAGGVNVHKQPPLEPVTPENLRGALELINLVADAVMVGDRQLLDKIPEVYAHLRGWPRGSAKLRAYERILIRWSNVDVHPRWAIVHLGDVFDAKFATLPEARLSEALDRIRMREAVDPDEVTCRQASELAVRVGAFTKDGAAPRSRAVSIRLLAARIRKARREA